MAENKQSSQLDIRSAQDVAPAQGLDQARLAAQTAQEKAMAELGKNVDQLARRLAGAGNRRPSEVYAAIKDRVFGALKTQIPDFDLLSLTEVAQRVGKLPPEEVQKILGEGQDALLSRIDTVIDDLAKSEGLTEESLARLRGEQGTEADTAIHLEDFRARSARLAGKIHVPKALEQRLPGDSPLSGVLNALRSFVGMSEMDVSPKDMMTFLTSFRTAELAQRGAALTPDNFRAYLTANSRTFLSLFTRSKTGVQSFLEFMKTSPGSMATVMGEIGRDGEALRQLDQDVRAMETLLPTLQRARLTPKQQSELQKEIQPLLTAMGLTSSGSLQSDLLALRQTMEKIEDTIASLGSFASLTLQEKAAYVRMLRELSSGKMTTDMVILALFVVQMGIGFGGGLIPSESGSWVGSKIADVVRPMLPSLQLKLTPDQVTGAIALGTALLGGTALAAGTATVVRQAYAARGEYEPGSPEFLAQQQADKVTWTPGREIEKRIQEQGARLLDDAFLVADFGGMTQDAMRRSVANPTAEPGYLSEPLEKVQRFRSALQQMGREMRASAETTQEESGSPLNVAQSVARLYDAKTAPFVARALESLDLKQLQGDALTERITEMLRANINVPAAFVAKAGEIALQVQKVREFSAKLHAKKTLEAYLASVLRSYHALEEVKKNPQLRLTITELLPVAQADTAPESKERSEDTPSETPILSQVELLAQTALFNLERKYFATFASNPRWMEEKFGTQERMMTLFGNAIMNSILRAMFGDQKATYVKPSAEFRGAQVSRWFLDMLPESQKKKQVELPPNFDAVYAQSLRDPTFPKRVTEELNRLISQAAGTKTTSEDVLLRADEHEGLLSGKRESALEQGLKKETETLLGQLGSVVESLGSNDAFAMLSVLRTQVVGQQSGGAAMQFLAKKMEETMQSEGGVSSFVQAWNRVTKHKDLATLLGTYDTLRGRVMQAGMADTSLEALEGEVAALRVLSALSATELMEVLEAAVNRRFWSGAGDVTQFSWGAAKMAFALVGVDRVASWMRMPDWKLPMPDLSSWKLPTVAFPAAQVDMQGLAFFGALTVSQYSMAAVLAHQTYGFEKGHAQQNVDPTRLGLKISETLAQTYHIREEGGVWRFEDEANQIRRIDQLLSATDTQSRSMVAALMERYGLSPSVGNAASSLRAQLMEELRSSFAQRKGAVLASAAALVEQVLRKEAAERTLSNPEEWIATQRERVQRMYLSVLATQLEREQK